MSWRRRRRRRIRSVELVGHDEGSPEQQSCREVSDEEARYGEIAEQAEREDLTAGLVAERGREKCRQALELAWNLKYLGQPHADQDLGQPIGNLLQVGVAHPALTDGTVRGACLLKPARHPKQKSPHTPSHPPPPTAQQCEAENRGA